MRSRCHARHDANTRGRANRNRAVGIGEHTSLLGELVHVRRERLRVAIQETGPVVEIVNADHQDIGPIRVLSLRSNKDKTREGND